MVEELAKANGVPGNNYEQTYVNTIVNTGRELVLFDTGNGRGRNPALGRLTELMEKAGYKPEQIDVVVITHGHPDHIGGLMTGDKPTFANARYIFGEAEFDFWKKGENVREARKANREQFMKVAVPLGEKATFVKTETRGRDRHPLGADVRPFAGAHGLPCRKQRTAPADLGRCRQPLHLRDSAAGLPGSFDDNPEAAVGVAQARARDGGDGAVCRDRLSHAVPGARLHRKIRHELPLGSCRPINTICDWTDIPAEPVLDCPRHTEDQP